MKSFIVLAVLVAAASAGQQTRQKRGYFGGHYDTLDTIPAAYSAGWDSSYAPISYASAYHAPAISHPISYHAPAISHPLSYHAPAISHPIAYQAPAIYSAEHYAPSLDYIPSTYSAHSLYNSAYSPILAAHQVVDVKKVVSVPKIVSVPKVVKVQKVVSVPQVITENKIVSSPYSAGYASGWW